MHGNRANNYMKKFAKQAYIELDNYMKLFEGDIAVKHRKTCTKNIGIYERNCYRGFQTSTAICL